MPVTTTVRVDGLRELGERMRKLSAEVSQKAAISATAAAAQVIKKRWKERLRANPSVDTGLLERNIISKKVPKSQLKVTSEHVVTVRKKDYPAERGKSRRNTKQVAIYIEYGTVKMPAEPAGKPAFDTGKERAVQVMAERLKRAIEKAGG